MNPGGEERFVYPQVLYKKEKGQLTLTPEGLAFVASALSSGTASAPTRVQLPWKDLVKHQVSPVSYPKALLKLIVSTNPAHSSNHKNLTFQFAQRSELDRIRREITEHLTRIKTSSTTRNSNSSNIAAIDTATGAKRATDDSIVSASSSNKKRKPSLFGGPLNPTALAVTRASLLAAHPSLRQQHTHLVQETATVTEDDFWETHQDLVQEEYARIAGMAKAGTSSLMQSHLPIAKGGRVTLGVEEMRQIFILYPAVHKAYEEKVPLELSDEQFWRKYLESEFFHRDRGRVGVAARDHGAGGALSENVVGSGGGAGGNSSIENGNKKSSGPSLEEQDARAAAVGTDDLFSRYDQKLRQELGQAVAEMSDSETLLQQNRKWGRKLAVGQFDLASTFETERGNLLEGPRDNHPPNSNDDGKGSRVIQKYNRHWAMVLHPDEAVAGADLTKVARASVDEVLPDDPDANPSGGVDAEMQRLVDFAQATEEEANHAAEIGHEDFAPLRLSNVEAYYAGRSSIKDSMGSSESTNEADQRYSVFVQAMAAKTQSLASSLASNGDSKYTLSAKCFPEGNLGRNLLSALTKRFAADSMAESASLEMVNQLPEDFRIRLKEYFRRSAELLRHFFGLRRLEAQGSTGHSQKLTRIVRGMETFYREMEGFRKELPQTETGKLMAKMCLPIMDQLDWAFQLNRERSGGGFVNVGGFVSVD